MAATGSHPAVKLKKHIQLPVETNRRPSNPPSQPDSMSTMNMDASSGSGYVQHRRRSTYKPGGGGLVTAAMNLRRMTRASIAVQDPPKLNVRFENTYKMEPDDGSLFRPSKIESVVYPMLEEHMKDFNYDPVAAAHITETIADAVKGAVKGLFSSRYKLITSVVIGQNHHQGMESASRCLWDEQKDNYATVCYKNNSMFAVVTVFAAYFE